jgi:hypothetical protein
VTNRCPVEVDRFGVLDQREQEVSIAGLKRFARIRGYISSARKNGVDAWQALHGLFTGDPWQPSSLIHAT